MGLDRVWQLDTASPVSNSNYQSSDIQEGCRPSGLNNALRALGSMIAQEIAYQGPAISASVSTNICTATSGLFQAILGSGAINSFGTVPSPQTSAAVLRFLQYSSSASLSHGGAIRLQGGVSRRTQPGDIQGVIHVGSADTWHEFLWSPADGGVTGGSISASTINAGSISATAISNVTFLAHKNGTSQDSISSTVVVTFGTEEWDIGGFFASNAWTPPAGKYRITATLSLAGVNKAATNETVIGNLRKGGVNHRRWRIARETSNSITTMVLTTIVDASGSDAFDITIGVASDPPIQVIGTATDTWFCGERI